MQLPPHLLRQEVEVAGADERLVLDRGIAQLLGRKLGGLEVGVRRHAARRVLCIFEF